MSSFDSNILRGQYIVPPLGSSGIFKLKLPFSRLLSPDAIYTCQALRRVSEYIASGESLEEIVYTPAGLSEDDLKADTNEDMVIASLQSEVGQWIYVPVRYMDAYPDTNGVAYRSVAVVLHLPAMPVGLDAAPLLADIKTLLRHKLGVECQAELQETSKAVLVSHIKHDQTAAQRSQLINTNKPDAVKVVELQQLIDQQTNVLQELEAYILTTINT